MAAAHLDAIKESIKQLQALLPKNTISVSITVDWKEMGEFPGQNIMPVVKMDYEVDFL